MQNYPLHPETQRNAVSDWLKSVDCGEIPDFVGKKNYLCARNKQKINLIYGKRNQRPAALAGRKT